MTFVGFVILALKCFNFLAWPVCSLGYPLCASISAIESNSSKDIQNLVTYWVSFSLISLFDHAFATLLYWNPLWPYMKLLAICWLVMHRFDGSLYVYEHIVHPCVLETPELVMNWFSERKEIFLSKAAERYIEENGVTEALQKLIVNKSKSAKPNFDIKEFKAVDAIEKNTERPEYKEPSIAQKEIKKVEVTQKKEVAAAKWPECKEPIAQSEIKKVEVTEKKEAATAKWVKKSEAGLSHTENKVNVAAVIEGASAAVKENKLPEIPAIKTTVQNEWTCALCQVKTSSETTLDAHLKGRRHKNKCEELKVKEAAKKRGSSASMTTNSGQPKVEPIKFAPPHFWNIDAGSTNQINSAKQEGKIKSSWISKQTCQTPTKSGIDINQSTLWCGICDARCTSFQDLVSHLNGRRHLDNAQKLTAFVGAVGAS